VPLIAVKRLHSPLKEDFDKEQSMLNSIAQRDHPHIVKLLATYRYRGKYHLLFPWAPCSLRVYWGTNPNPGWNRTSVLWMLEQLEGLTCGLYEVHNFKINKAKPTPSTMQTPDPTRLLVPGTVTDISVAAEDYLYGRHGDLKPENILWSNEIIGVDPMGVLQIADFGLGRFHGRASRSQMLAKSSIASPTYEPPEIPLNEKVSRAYDIWSLGCVFLEFITWRLGGRLLLGEFERLRLVDGGDDITNDKFFTVINYNKPGQDAVVRKGVLDWIQILLQHPRCSGAMSQLLAIVRDDMLVILPKRRIECKDLRERLINLRKRAEGDEFFLLGNALRTFTDVEDIQNITSSISQTAPQVSMLNDKLQMFEKHGTPEITLQRPPSEEG
jgi:serine/threonine protein kinase